MPSFNKMHIVGYIGRDARVRHDDGHAECIFPVATNDRSGSSSPHRQNPPTWFRICIGGTQVEYFADHLTKGMLVYVEGRLTARQYTDRSGAAKTGLDVRATCFVVLSGGVEELMPAHEEDTEGTAEEVEEDLSPI